MVEVEARKITARLFAAFRPLLWKVTFGEGKFGFTLFRAESGAQKGRGIVSRVSQNGNAQSLGVKVGDVVTGVNRRRCVLLRDSCCFVG